MLVSLVRGGGNWVKINNKVQAGRFLAIVVVGALLPFGAALAQSQPGFDQREAERQKKALEEQRKAREASEGQQQFGDKVSYADVLKDPDNVDLNFRYAKSQIADGNVRGAAGTLERILLVTPDLPQIRLTYAIVLYRLDNIDEAEREFNRLKKLKMAASLRAEIDRFLAAIKQRRQKTKYRVQFSAGVKRDSNVNAAPRSGRILAAGLEFAPIGRGQKQKDYAILGIIAADVRQDLGKQSRDEIFAGVSYYHNEQFAIDPQDLQSGGANFGLKLPFENFVFTPKFTYTNLRLSREKFFSGYAAELRFDRSKVIPAWGIAGHFLVRGTRENFHQISETTTGLQRTGFRWEWEMGLNKQINPQHRLEGAAKFTRKLPQSFAPNDYRGYKIGLRHSWALGEGQFILSSASYEAKLYKQEDPAVTPFQVRHDNLVRLSVTYGAPLGTMLDRLSLGKEGNVYYDALKDITWTITGELTEQGSNIRNFSYANRRAQMMFSRTWNF